MNSREFAWRVFANEYNASTLEQPSNNDRAPGYIITPLGAKINRVYIVGVLTEIEKLERNGGINYRARVSDRTGVFYLYAGQYDPEAVNVLSKLEPPTYIAVVGKSKMYSPNDQNKYVSIRPESITVVDKNVRDYWLLATCKSMKDRLEALVEAEKMAAPDIEKLTKLGFDPNVSQGVIEALNHYKDLNIVTYRNMVVDVLRYLVQDNPNDYANTMDSTEKFPDEPELKMDFQTAEEYSEESDNDELEFEPSTNSETYDPGSGKEMKSEEIEKYENKLLKIIESYKGKKYSNGVPWHDLVAKADKKGIDKDLIEDIVNNLLDRGKVYEPMLGKIKRTNT